MQADLQQTLVCFPFLTTGGSKQGGWLRKDLRQKQQCLKVVFFFFFLSRTLPISSCLFCITSLLVFSVWWDIILTVSFSPLYVIFFSSLSTCKKFFLKSLPTPVTRISQGRFLFISFFPLCIADAFSFIGTPYNFLLKIGHFEYYNVTTLETKFPLFFEVCCCFLW